MREKKYIEFLRDVSLPKERENYIKNVKYRILDETNDSYVVSKRKNISFSKVKEGELFSVGLF
jgi:hypothetical protein